jgi:hypothetical protein
VTATLDSHDAATGEGRETAAKNPGSEKKRLVEQRLEIARTQFEGHRVEEGKGLEAGRV